MRSPLEGILVVEGAPGCGKTVVALHRAAYLLYTYRDRLARSGVRQLTESGTTGAVAAASSGNRSR